MLGVLQVPRREAGERPPQGIAEVDEHALGLPSRSPSVCARMSHLDLRVVPPGCAGHSMGMTGVGLPIGKKPTETCESVMKA